jgi:hypothetical protein
MALILLGSNRLAAVSDTRRKQAVRHQNSVFHSITKHIPVVRLPVSCGGARRRGTGTQTDDQEPQLLALHRIGLLPHRLVASRKNPFADPVREVRVRIETGKVLRILSNDLDASAEKIAALYKGQ